MPNGEAVFAGSPYVYEGSTVLISDGSKAD